MGLGALGQWLHARCKQLQEASRAWLGRASLLCSLIRRSPHVLVVPLALFCLMTALGIWGVKTAVRNTEEAERSKAALDADSASQALLLAIQRATLPLTQLAEIVKLMPQWSQIEKQWAISAPAVWLGASKGSLLLIGSPMGITRLLFEGNSSQAIVSKSMVFGFNTLVPPLRDITLDALNSKNELTLQGPVVVNSEYFLCSFARAMFFSDMPANDTWDFKFNERLCPPGLCYNNSTRTRWWGGIGLMMDSSYLFGADGPLSTLPRKGYQFQLWYPKPSPAVVTSFASMPILGSAGGKQQSTVTIKQKEVVRGLTPITDVANKAEPADAIAISLPVVDQMWELHVWKDSWTPSWMMPLIAVVVLGAFLVSVLVFTTLYSWAEHRALLHSLLPKDTIKRMRNEGQWATGQGDEAIKTAGLETPAELMLRIIEDCIAGRNPAFPLLLSVRDALHRSADVYRPSEQQMRNRIDELTGMDDDVRDALAAQLMNDFKSGVLPKRPQMVEADTHSDDMEDNVDIPPGLIAYASEARASPDIIHQSHNSDLALIASTVVADETEPAEMQDGTLSQALSFASRKQVTWNGNEVVPRLTSWLLQAPAATMLVAGNLKAPAATEAKLEQPVLADGLVEPVTRPAKPLLTQLEKVLYTADDWAFDAFALEEASHGRPLSCLGYWLLHKTGLKSWAHIKTHRLISFLEKIEAGYADNPYHNKRHAADVLQSVHVIMHRSGLMPGFADQLTLLGCYLSAIVHDFEHVGRTNDFLINSSDELAVRYNDRSPMENHHLAAAWSILKTKECNILSGLPASDVGKLRKLVIDLVLGTDMKQHFAIQGQFETMARLANDQVASVHSAGNPGHPHAGPEDQTKPGVHPINDQDQLLSLQTMLKCADLGHLSAPLQVHLKWVSALEAEFFLQGDAERALGLPISPLCDRTKEGVTKSQIGFFDFVVLPGFKTFCNRFKGAEPLLGAVLSNQAYWKGCAATGR